jgi:MFS family permease
LAPDLSTQFGWSNTDYANIASVFQFVYAISMLFAGRVVDKIGTKTAYVIAIGVWSTGAIMHAFAVPMGEGIAALSSALGLAVIPVSIAGFMLSRAVLAIGEAGNFPIAIKATAEYFPKKERSFATGIFNSGANVGAILAPICVPLIAALWGWEAAFIVIGAFGLRLGGGLDCAVRETLSSKNACRRRNSPISAATRARKRDRPPGLGRHREKSILVQAADLPPDLGLCLRQVHDRWRVVVLPVLASDLPVGAIRHEGSGHRAAAGRVVHHDHGGQHRWRLVPQLFHVTGRRTL